MSEHGTHDTTEIYDRAGLDNRIGYGTTPAVIVDLQRGFTDPACPLGGELSSLVDRTNDVLAAAHDTDVPVVFTRIVTNHPNAAGLGTWVEKIPPLEVLSADSEWTETTASTSVTAITSSTNDRRARFTRPS